ncbi:hypothetical protein O7634_12840 [Micromonospora sp. WMMD1120]|uniref:hypothetical protein n=1 Tax=Micromonospora sp. WMMD1120 TaxID=3016106 RepID=UPI00241609AB|nr:hypothetical protein [Micromonospora sp. WMMD1120]MDG4807639.1 hypothetical protein [Micromonospora sp. WMMD1120]
MGRWLRLPARFAPADHTLEGDMTSTEYAWGYAIRREWPDGTHDLFGFTADTDTATRQLNRDRSFWRSGPVRPTAVYLVPANAADVGAHPVDGCRRSGCPDSPKRGQR